MELRVKVSETKRNEIRAWKGKTIGEMYLCPWSSAINFKVFSLDFYFGWNG
jgi:hypothetical protein